MSRNMALEKPGRARVAYLLQQRAFMKSSQFSQLLPGFRTSVIEQEQSNGFHLFRPAAILFNALSKKRVLQPHPVTKAMAGESERLVKLVGLLPHFIA